MEKYVYVITNKLIAYCNIQSEKIPSTHQETTYKYIIK